MPLSVWRNDERKYSHVTRKLVILVEHIPPNRIFNTLEVAQEIHNGKYPEFQINRDGKPKSISPSRIQDYIRYANDLGIITNVENGYRINFERKTSDAEWTTVLSDCAAGHLIDQFNVTSGQLIDQLEEIITRFFAEKRLCTPHNIAVEFGIIGGRALEITKWSLAVYADGPTCRFSIVHYPLFVTNSIRDTADRASKTVDPASKNEE